ncbi:hypothetical protein BJP25_00300 [Actinokineospora bangkokensis]|uniref:Glycosyltransferase RgtA/B/C/D-like domain-containing protein n=1 Tax=Actinokineospora bangkokensis TaxID=1193682 RepID=A0A1Q9LU94_9PSEU|nr:hypothetical protein BJP25_00300 [Actinokineospora bangkokensis]
MWLIELLALVPVAATLVDVLGGPHLQFLDYWQVLLNTSNPDGSLHPSGFFTLRNEHPLVLPALAYWLNVAVSHGDNRVLGCLVVAIGVLTVVVLRAALPRSLPPVARAALVVGASALVFSPHGLHNFIRSMSGTAWLTANLLVICALLLARRGWWVPAWGVGLLACLSYGTGFPVWVALAWLAWVRREAVWKRVVPLVVLVGVGVAWKLLDRGPVPGGSPTSDPVQVLFTFFAAVGHLWTTDSAGVAVVAGVLVLAAYAVLLTTSAARAEELRVWWALALHAVLACAMIGVARVDFGEAVGLSSRYTSQSVVMAVPLMVIAGWLLVRRSAANGPRVAVLAVAAGFLGFTLGMPVAAALREESREVPLQAVALRAGLGAAYPDRLPNPDELMDLLPKIGHYPFTEDFTLGCGGPELGDRVDIAGARPLPAADPARKADPSGFMEEAQQLPGATRIRGWATGGADPIHCAAVVDGSGVVVGGGIVNQARPDVTAALPWVTGGTGFVVIGPTATPDTKVVFVRKSGAVLWAPAPTEEGEK